MKMMIRASIALCALATANTAAAKTDWTKQKLDPAMAYVLLQLEPVEFKFMGNNNIATGVSLAPYDAEKRQIVATEGKKKTIVVNRVLLAKDPIGKDGKRRQYFAVLAPGNWVIEGAGGGGGTLGAPMTAFSLGSYQFEAKPGEVIDLGVLAPKREDSDNPDTKMSTGKAFGMLLGGGLKLEPIPLMLQLRPRATGDLPLPSWIDPAKLTTPAMTYGATFANSFGGLINRVDGSAGRKRTVGEVSYPSRPPL